MIEPVDEEMRNFIAFQAIQDLWTSPLSDAIIEKRVHFLNNTYTDTHGNVTGLGATPAAVHRLQVKGLDGVTRTSVCLMTQRGSIFEFVRRIRKAIYGEVICGNVVVNTPEGLMQDAQSVAIKRLNKKWIALRAASPNATEPISPKQEDPLGELTAIKYLSIPGHPNVIQAIDIADAGTDVYKIEKFCGDELFSVLCERDIYPNSRFPELIAKKYFKELIDGVDYIHKKGVVHLDLSLENLLLDESEDKIRIIDFGLARRIPTEDGVEVNFPAGAMKPTNKTFYTAPEIYSVKEFSGVKADLWACTTMLFIMLTGIPAFVIPTVEDDTRFAAINNGELNRLVSDWKLATYLSPQVLDFLNVLFQVDYTRRPSVEEMRSHAWML